ncbi:hypothetical protein BDU57DRAFT_518892 [Ampelomyces quisqualis]|uniref:Extracellular membrane protein CFEM domain-containing protein n=1 Tax=Ampelomyces quisqualis TaxID=50730 RepID=A0A6A5QH17_AMPQU|nr:hypothetical protein BDU57DRAFT_518892 [Ampelomyces quisqualis]
MRISSAFLLLSLSLVTSATRPRYPPLHHGGKVRSTHLQVKHGQRTTCTSTGDAAEYTFSSKRRRKTRRPHVPRPTPHTTSIASTGVETAIDEPVQITPVSKPTSTPSVSFPSSVALTSSSSSRSAASTSSSALSIDDAALPQQGSLSSSTATVSIIPSSTSSSTMDSLSRLTASSSATRTSSVSSSTSLASTPASAESAIVLPLETTSPLTLSLSSLTEPSSSTSLGISSSSQAGTASSSDTQLASSTSELASSSATMSSSDTSEQVIIATSSSDLASSTGSTSTIASISNTMVSQSPGSSEVVSMISSTSATPSTISSSVITSSEISSAVSTCSASSATPSTCLISLPPACQLFASPSLLGSILSTTDLLACQTALGPLASNSAEECFVGLGTLTGSDIFSCLTTKILCTDCVTSLPEVCTSFFSDPSLLGIAVFAACQSALGRFGQGAAADCLNPGIGLTFLTGVSAGACLRENVPVCLTNGCAGVSISSSMLASPTLSVGSSTVAIQSSISASPTPSSPTIEASSTSIPTPTPTPMSTSTTSSISSPSATPTPSPALCVAALPAVCQVPNAGLLAPVLLTVNTVACQLALNALLTPNPAAVCFGTNLLSTLTGQDFGQCLAVNFPLCPN